MEPKKRFKLEHWQMVALGLMLFDAVAIVASFLLALLFRFDFVFKEIPDNFWQYFKYTIFVYVIVCLLLTYFARLYRCIWRFYGVKELIRLTMAVIIECVAYLVVTSVIGLRMPLSYYLGGAIFQLIATSAIRCSYRVYLLIRKSFVDHKMTGVANVMIIGAGAAGREILRSIRESTEATENVRCFIDDNSNKWDRDIDGVKVVGGRESIAECVSRFGIRKIYVCIPSAKPSELKKILEICKETDCELKNLPGSYALRSGQVEVSAMKEVDIVDLLGRDPVKVNMDEIYSFIEGKKILVTGVGSIGSELARQIAGHNPKQLILFDIYENNAYDIQMELRRDFPELDLKTIIGSVRDSRKLWQVFDDFRPDIVYHAAAHKHVPLMEDSPCEAIKNNTIGTYKTAYAAMVFGVQRFVLISTDKAVNPTNIMGASKRLCEMSVQAFDAKIKEGRAGELPELFTHFAKESAETEFIRSQLLKAHTEFVAVRFGNVLGSNGSVIPLFKKQIEAGGPVTVTHPDIIRYFMTIPEAVSLVMQAGVYAKGGEIFVLDMGEPIKIDTLARNLIRLSGHKPDEDIKIEYIGLRPGEKLFEEKLMSEEGLRKTDNELIHIGAPIAFDVEDFLQQLSVLLQKAYKNSSDIRGDVMKVVNTYNPANL